MSAKQDRQGARTATDLERKYNFGKTFAELMGLSRDTRNYVDKVSSELANELRTQVTQIYRDTEKIILSALEDYVKTTEYEDHRKTSEAEFKVMADQISATVESTETIDNDLQSFKETSKGELKVLSNQISANVSTTTEIKTDLEDYKKSSEADFAILSDRISANAETTTEISNDLEDFKGTATGRLDVMAGEINANVTKTTELQNDLNAFKESNAAELEIMSDQISMGVATSTEELKKVSNDLQGMSDELDSQAYATEQLWKTVESELKLMADKLTMTFESATEQIISANGEIQTVRENLEKHFDFSADGLTIKAGENSMQLVLDNDLIKFVKNGQEFGWWDGTDFHTGNIVVELNERAQFGNFAFVPRSNGSLDFLKVGG